MGEMFKYLEEGLKDILDYHRGKKKLRTKLVEVPKPPKTYKAKDVKRIRKKLSYSQGIFAQLLNVSIKTIQSWEAGRRIPSHAALRLLEIVDKGYPRHAA
jgi:putative transcriptional regulator